MDILTGLLAGAIIWIASLMLAAAINDSSNDRR
jgi:hypothetical protein